MVENCHIGCGGESEDVNVEYIDPSTLTRAANRTNLRFVAHDFVCELEPMGSQKAQTHRVKSGGRR
jgi:hypothetical protein